MGLLDVFKKKESDSALPQVQLQLTADELIEQGKVLESHGKKEIAFKTYLQAAKLGNTLVMHKVA